MLVLTRKINETILIGENIRVTIRAIHGRQIRLAIEAPQEVTVEPIGHRAGATPSGPPLILWPTP